MRNLLLLLSTTLILSCSLNDDKSYPEIVSQKELTMTIASEMLLGIKTDQCTGSDYGSSLFAIKESADAVWKQFDYYIEGFEFVEGNEYEIKVLQSRMHDPRNSVTYWDEYTLIEELSKEAKESENLPESFLPPYCSNEDDDRFFIINPAHYIVGSDKKLYIDNETSIVNYPYMSFINKGLYISDASGDISKYVPTSAKIINDLNEEKIIRVEMPYVALLYINISDIITLQEIERLIAKGDGASVNYLLKLYDTSGEEFQETTLTFTYDENY